MTDTDLDQAIREQLERLVADAPLPPSVDDITIPTLRPAAPSRRRPLLVWAAAAVVLLAVVGALVLRGQGDDGASPPASEPAGPRTYGEVQEPPPGAGELPRLVVTLPGWVADPYEDSGPVACEDCGEFRVAYYGTVSAWQPLVEVITTTGGYGLGDGREVPIQSHAGTVGDWGNGARSAGWNDGDETVVVNVDGYTEPELLAMAESLVRNGDGQYVLPTPPPGTVELFRTQDPNPLSSSSGAMFTAPDDTPADGGFEVEITMYSGGPEVLWDRLSDKLLGAYETEELVIVRGQRALIAESDGDYRVIWPERDGDAAIEVLYAGDRATLDRILDSLVEVDEATWQALRASPAAVTPATAPATTGPPPTTMPFVSSPTTSPGVSPTTPFNGATCTAGYTPSDLDDDGEIETCLRDDLASPDG